MNTKISAIELYDKGQGLTEIAKFIGCSKCSIQDWISQRTHLEDFLTQNKSSNNKRLSGGGRKLLDQDIDDSLIQWIYKERSNYNSVSYWRFLAYAKSLPNPNKMLFSRGWLYFFMRRHGLSYRKRSTKIIVDQNVVQAGIDRFFDSLIITLANNSQLILFANIDETRVEKDQLSDFTIDEKGVKQVPIRTTNSDRIG